MIAGEGCQPAASFPAFAFLLEIIRRVQSAANPSDRGPVGFGFPKDDHVIAHQNYKQLVSGFKAQSLTGLARDDNLAFGLKSSVRHSKHLEQIKAVGQSLHTAVSPKKGLKKRRQKTTPYAFEVNNAATLGWLFVEPTVRAGRQCGCELALRIAYRISSGLKTSRRRQKSCRRPARTRSCTSRRCYALRRSAPYPKTAK